MIMLGVNEAILDVVEVDAREATETASDDVSAVENGASIELEEMTRSGVLVEEETKSELDEGKLSVVVGRLGLSVLLRALVGVAKLELANTILLEDVGEAAELDVEMDELPDGIVNVPTGAELDPTDDEDMELAGVGDD